MCWKVFCSSWRGFSLANVRHIWSWPQGCKGYLQDPHPLKYKNGKVEKTWSDLNKTSITVICWGHIGSRVAITKCDLPQYSRLLLEKTVVNPNCSAFLVLHMAFGTPLCWSHPSSYPSNKSLIGHLSSIIIRIHCSLRLSSFHFIMAGKLHVIFKAECHTKKETRTHFEQHWKKMIICWIVK